MKTPKIPAHPTFGEALKPDKFIGRPRHYAWYAAICSCILKATVAEQCAEVVMGRTAFCAGVRRMWETGGFLSKPRAYEVTVYTTEVMQAAKHILQTNLDLLNFKDLFMLMKEHGHFSQAGSLDRFRAAFKAYCKTQEDPVTVNSTKTTWYLAPSDYPMRAAIAFGMLECLKHWSLDSLVFVDEVVLEECAHPKGEQCLGTN